MKNMNLKKQRNIVNAAIAYLKKESDFPFTHISVSQVLYFHFSLIFHFSLQLCTNRALLFPPLLYHLLLFPLALINSDLFVCQLIYSKNIYEVIMVCQRMCQMLDIKQCPHRFECSREEKRAFTLNMWLQKQPKSPSVEDGLNRLCFCKMNVLQLCVCVCV